MLKRLEIICSHKKETKNVYTKRNIIQRTQTQTLSKLLLSKEKFIVIYLIRLFSNNKLFYCIEKFQ